VKLLFIIIKTCSLNPNRIQFSRHFEFNYLLGDGQISLMLSIFSAKPG